MTDVSKNMLTVGEASVALGVSVDTIRRWAKLGLLRCVRNERGDRLFDLAEIERTRRQHEAPRTSRKPRFKVRKAGRTDHQALELFAGGGGTALGLENAGFRHILLNEIDVAACDTLRLNRPKWNVVGKDIHELSFHEYRGKVALLQGGVPCQAFSYAGKSQGFGDTRGTLFFEFARAIEEVQPKVIMMENVRGLLSHDNGKTLKTMLQTLMALGYDVAVKVLRAQFLDVAQKRERLVIIGAQTDLQLPLLFPAQDRPVLTVWDAIGDCPSSPGASYPDKKRKILDLVPPGGYWRDLPADLQKEYLQGSYHLSGGKTGMARRLSWDEPSLTLTCAPAQKQTERCHPGETRPLTVREYARIQSFPDDWEFSGSVASQYKQIGNAVPVNMAYHIGRALISMLEGDVNSGHVLVEPLRRQALDPELISKEALCLF